MQKLTQKISGISLIMGFLIIPPIMVSTTTVCLAGSEDAGLQFMSSSNQIQSQGIREPKESQEEQGFIDLLKIDHENERSKINFNYIFGLFLDFSRGNISINELEAEVGKRASICRDQEKGLSKKDGGEVEKLYAAAKREVWDKLEKAISSSKKRLEKKVISIGDLQKDYGESAIKWFSSQYGMKGKFEDKGQKIDSDATAAPIVGLSTQNKEQFFKQTK